MAVTTKPKSDAGSTATKEELLSLAQYIEIAKPHPGAVASFKIEAKNDTSTARTQAQWDKDFNIQAKREYR